MLEGKREFIAKDPQSLILQQGWASVSLDTERWRMELRSLYEHLQECTRSETLPSTACGVTPQLRRTSQ